MQPVQSASDESLGRLVAKNTFYLTASQALTVPIAVLVNATLARFLGPAAFGFLYLASTLCGFGFLAVNWGHESALPALIARERSRAGALLGSSLAWRVMFSFVAYGVMALICHLLHYESEFQWALGLTFAITLLTSLIAACKDTVRGFERTDIPAYVHVGQQFLTALFIIPALFLGGGMRMSLVVQIPVSIFVLFLLSRSLQPVGVGRISFDKQELKALMAEGTPFVFLGLATALQPNIDAVYLSKLAPTEVMGWFAVSRRLIGVLLFPASALVGALYPTLCRLYSEDLPAYIRVCRGSFSSVALIAVPVALGCLMYPEVGVSLFSRKSFSAAEDNLRVLSLFLFLLYFSMPLLTAVLAAGKKRASSFTQAGCVIVSLVLDPILIPWFQRRSGNGGLGLCVAAVISEAFVVACAITLMPRGVFDRRLIRSLALAFVSGCVMALVAHLLKPWLSPFIGAPIAVTAYGVALWATGGVDPDQMAQLKAQLGKRFARFR